MGRNIIFDLDGTLTDSGEGIMNCAKTALEHYGIEVSDFQALRVFVGPPLDETFVKFGVPKDQSLEAVRVFRSRYLTVGKFENHPYPGVHNTLAYLRSQGHKLYVATSKPETTSIEILDKFEMSQYFEKICGATLDKSRSSKSAVIAYLLENGIDSNNSVMIGDTAFDVLGAAEHKIPTIGVSWGYGLVEDMEKAGAVAIAHSMDELVSLINLK